MMWRLLIGIFLVAMIASALLWSALVHVQQDAGGHLCLDQLRFFLDAYKAIGVAFLVALLAVVIPQMLPECRDRFERFKASREAYSQAKTSVMYLPERLATLAFPEAVAAVKDAHHNLHLAETYPKELRKHLHWHQYPPTWVDRNFWELFALRMVLDRHVDGWSTLTPGKRLQALREALEVVAVVFGPGNVRWSGLKQEKREQEIEAALKSKVVPDGPTGGHA